MNRTSAALFSFAFAGCVPVGTTPSKVADDAQIAVHGQYLNDDGSPSATKEVAMHRNTLGCAQWSGLFLGADSPFAGDTIDAQGNHRFSVQGSQTKGIGNPALRFTVTTRNTESWGVFHRQFRAWANFNVQQGDVEVPALKPWDGQPQASVAAGTLNLAWADLTTTHGFAATDDQVRLSTSDGGTLWQAPPARRPRCPCPPTSSRTSRSRSSGRWRTTPPTAAARRSNATSAARAWRSTTRRARRR